MPISTYEQLQNVYRGLGPLFDVRVFAMCDFTHYLGTDLPDASGTTFVVQFPGPPQVRPGDIVEIADEDMLVNAVTPPVLGSQIVFVKRQYAGTVFTQLHQSGFPVATWRELTGRSSPHGVKSIGRIKNAFEASLGRYASSSLQVTFHDRDGFWRKLAFGEGQLYGFTSLRQHWFRFYLFLRNGLDTRALGTFLLDSIDCSAPDEARFDLVAINSLMRGDTQADRARVGREIMWYRPTTWMVARGLNQIRAYRTPGIGRFQGLRIPWQRNLSAGYARELALPAGQRAVSYLPRPGMFSKPSPNDSFLTMTEDSPTTSGPSIWVGGEATAQCWDPQVVGAANVKTGDVNRPGRLYFGRGADIVEYDPVTKESNVAVANLNSSASGTQWIIRALWYNPNDPAAAGKPKICGLAFTEATLFMHAAMSSRGQNAKGFRWNGGTLLTSSFEVTSSQFWSGHYFFRDGLANATENRREIGGAGGGDNLSLPFRQMIYGASDFDPSDQGRIEGRNGITAAFITGTTRTEIGTTLPNFTTGVTIDSPGYGTVIPPAALPAGGQSYTLHYAVEDLDDTIELNCRFTHGQQGAFAFTTENAAGGHSWIAYCTINTTTGVVAVKVWDIHADTHTTVHTYDAKEKQPCMIAGLGLDCTADTKFVVGLLEMFESSNCRAHLDKLTYVASTWARVADYYTSATESGGNQHQTPLWGTLCDNGLTLVVSWFNRKELGSLPFGIRSYGTTAASFSAANPTYLSGSMLHAFCQKGGGGLNLYAQETNGRIVEIVVPAGGGAITSITPLDRGYPVVDTEGWSATLALVWGGDATNVVVYGVSAPCWPFDNAIRGGIREGLYQPWRYAATVTDVYELADGKDQSVEDFIAGLGFGSNGVLAISRDGRGTVEWIDRIDTPAPVCTISTATERNVRMAKRTGYKEIENFLEVTPYIPRIGDMKVTVHLNPREANKSPEPPEIQSRDFKRQVIVMRCVNAGRVGVAQFAYYAQAQTLRTWLVIGVAAGSTNNIVQIATMGRGMIGPNDDTSTQNHAKAFQIPRVDFSVGAITGGTITRSGARVRMPDGFETTVNNFSENGGMLIIGLEAAWVPTQYFPPGAPIEIDQPFARMWTDVSSDSTNPQGFDVVTSSYLWQEIGGGKPQATGVMIRWPEPADDGVSVNFNETAWQVGEMIVLEVPGMDLLETDAQKITLFDPASSEKYGKQEFKGKKGAISARRVPAIASSRFPQTARPRWIWNVSGIRAPWLQSGMWVTLYNPREIPTAPYTENVKIRSIEVDPETLETQFEAIGAVHD